MEKIGDQPVGKITFADVVDYMTYLRTEYVLLIFANPNPGHDVPTRKPSPKTMRNYWITFKACFGWIPENKPLQDNKGVLLEQRCMFCFLLPLNSYHFKYYIMVYQNTCIDIFATKYDG